MSPSKSVISPPSSITSRLASVTLANKMFVKEIGKTFRISHEYTAPIS